ncbi:MAG TPA: DUF1552 domain-containing protein [Polyangia bacterium]
MAKSFALDRRALLKGAFGTAVSLPLLEAMFEKSVYAQVSSAPKRFVFAYCGIPPCGEDVNKTTGKPDQFVIPDAPGPLNAAFKIGLEPLEMLGLRQDTTVISSLRIPRTGMGNGRRYGASGFHYETMGPIVSGVSAYNDNFSRYALGPSCDWLVAQKLGMATRFPSLVYCVQSAEHTPGYTLDYISFQPKPVKDARYDPPTTRNDPIISPRVAFDRLFNGFVPPKPGMPTEMPAPPSPELLARKDILARVQKAYTRLQPKLGASDKQRLDQHISNVQKLEQRVNASLSPTSSSALGHCAIPTMPGADPGPSAGYANEDERAANFVDLIHMAFSCDLSRVVSLELTSSMSGIVLPTSLGITYRNWDGSPLSPPPLHEATHGKGNNLSVAECIRWHVKHLAALAKKLKDTPDVTGNMLDNTVIVLAFEAGFGNTRLEGKSIVGERPPHTSEGMIALVIGGRGLGMQLGTHLVAPEQHPAAVSLSAMRAVAGSQMNALGDITTEIPGLRI